MSYDPIFSDALRVAPWSNVRRFKTGAALYNRKGELLSVGWSHISHRRLVTTPWSKHAEHHALARLGPREVPYRIVVATLSAKGNVTSGRPCASCARLIEKAGIVEVFYTQRIETSGL